jgi:hypothetical protein
MPTGCEGEVLPVASVPSKAISIGNAHIVASRNETDAILTEQPAAVFSIEGKTGTAKNEVFARAMMPDFSRQGVKSQTWVRGATT